MDDNILIVIDSRDLVINLSDCRWCGRTQIP